MKINKIINANVEMKKAYHMDEVIWNKSVTKLFSATVNHNHYANPIIQTIKTAGEKIKKIEIVGLSRSIDNDFDTGLIFKYGTKRAIHLKNALVKVGTTLDSTTIGLLNSVSTSTVEFYGSESDVTITIEVTY